MTYDARWVREGRPLREWLVDLLGPGAGVRRRAENAVSAMYWGAERADVGVQAHVPADWAGHRAAWGAEVARILLEPGFGGERYVEAALGQMRADHRGRMERLALEDRYFGWDDDAPAMTEVEKQALLEEIGRRTAEEKGGLLPNSFGTHVLHMVIEHAGRVLLRMPGVVRAALRDDVCAGAIAGALEKLGPAAEAFAPDLLSDEQPAARERGVPHPSALAAVGREDAATVRALADRLLMGDGRAGFGASDALRQIGPAAARLVPTLVDELMAAFDDEGRQGGIVSCVAAVAPERPDVFERVLEAARPGEPEWAEVPEFPGHRFDRRVWRRGGAIGALGHFRAFADEALAVLVDALDTFEEYDPDWQYDNREHGRVVDAIERVAPGAGDAAIADVVVPALLRHLREPEGEVDWRVVKSIGRLGVRARAALPALRQLDAEVGGERVAGEEPQDWHDPVGWAIWRVGVND